MEQKTKTIGIQTDPCMTPYTNDASILFCWSRENDTCTQTEICIQQPQKHHNVIIDKPIVTTIEKICGPDINMNLGFMGFADIATDSSMRELAGVSREFFAVLLNLIELGKDGQPAFYKTLGKENRLLLFLMKLKLGITFCALGVLFHVHKTTVSRIFFEVLQTLTEKTKTWIFWPSKESVKKNLPVTFSKYPNCRCIIDCTEISTDTPATVEQRVLMYSNYKGRFTVKFLIAITPDGYICKVSKAYGGRSTDCFITNDCGFLNLIEPNDLVLADKGFPQIKSELGKRNATLVIPPFAVNPQFSDEEVEEGYSIASVRIHVERAIQRVKLSKILSHISADLLSYIDAIMHVCCVIANSLPPLIEERNKEKTLS